MGPTLTPRQLALGAGALGLLLGAAALVSDYPGLGLAAGVMALVAGLVAHSVTGNPAAAVAARQADETETGAELDAVRAELDESLRRIRELEAALAESDGDPVAAALGEGAVLTDPETRLFSEPYFRVALDARIASARRHLRPVAVALIDVAEGQVSGTAVAAPPERVAEALRTTVRDADTACRLADGTFAVILEDTPENGAVWTVERVRRNLVSNHGNHTLWAGVACYPAHAFSAEEVVAQAGRALTAAREWRQDRIEVAIAE